MPGVFPEPNTVCRNLVNRSQKCIHNQCRKSTSQLMLLGLIKTKYTWKELFNLPSACIRCITCQVHRALKALRTWAAIVHHVYMLSVYMHHVIISCRHHYSTCTTKSRVNNTCYLHVIAWFRHIIKVRICMLPATNCYVAVFTAHLLHISMEICITLSICQGKILYFFCLHATPS